MTRPPRPARWIERAALALLAAGVALHGVAFVRMRALEAGASAVDAEATVLFAGLAAHARYARWAEGGVALVVLGLATAVAASVWTVVARRRATAGA